MTETSSSTLRSAAGTAAVGAAVGAAKASEAAVVASDDAEASVSTTESSAPSSSRLPTCTRNRTSNDRKWIPIPPPTRRGIEGKKNTNTDRHTLGRGPHHALGRGGRGRGRGRGYRRQQHHSPSRRQFRRDDVPPPPPPRMHRVKTYERLADAEVVDSDKENRDRNNTSSTSSSASSVAATASCSTKSSSASRANRHPVSQGADPPTNNQIKNKLSTKTNSDRTTATDLVEAAANRRAAELELLALIGAVRIDDGAFVDNGVNGAAENDGDNKTAAAKAAGGADASSNCARKNNNKNCQSLSRRKGYRGAGGLKFAAASYDAIVEEATRFANELERIEWERVVSKEETKPSASTTSAGAVASAEVNSANGAGELGDASVDAKGHRRNKGAATKDHLTTNEYETSLRLKERIEAASAAKRERLARLTAEDKQHRPRDAGTCSEASIATPVMSNKGSSFLHPNGHEEVTTAKVVPSPVVIEERIEAASKAKIDRRIEERIAMASAAKRERLQQQQGIEDGDAIAASPVEQQRTLSYSSPRGASSGMPMQCAVGVLQQPPRLGYLCPKYGPLHGKAVTNGEWATGTVYYYPPQGYLPYDPTHVQGASTAATTSMIQDTPATLHLQYGEQPLGGGQTETTVEKTDAFASATTPTRSMPPHLLPLPSVTRKDRPQDMREEPRPMAPPSSLRVHSPQQQKEQAELKQQQQLSERESFLAQQRKREEEAAEILAEETRKAVLVETQQNRTAGKAAGKATRVHVPPRKRVNGVR